MVEISTLRWAGVFAPAASEYGRANPIFSETGTDNFYIVSNYSGERAIWSLQSAEEISVAAKENDIALLEEDSNLAIEIPTKPLCVFADKNLLTKLEATIPATLAWRPLQTGLIAALVEQHLTEAIVDKWSAEILEFTDRRLSGYLDNPEEETFQMLEGALQTALGGALGPDLRIELYASLGFLYKKSRHKLRLYNLFELFVAHEFPSMEWGDFFRMICSLQECQEDQIMPSVGRHLSREPDTDLLLEGIENSKAGSTKVESLEIACQYSTRFAKNFNRDVLANIIHSMTDSGDMKLDLEGNEITSSLAAIPASYLDSEPLPSGLFRVGVFAVMQNTLNFKREMKMPLSHEEKVLVELVS